MQTKVLCLKENTDPPAFSATVKSVHMHGKQKISHKCNMGIKKNAEFDAVFKSVEKAAKKLAQKSYQWRSDRKMMFFVLLQNYYVQKCLAYNFFV